MPSLSSFSPKLPSGYRLLKLEAVDSTNAEAMRRARAGEPGPLWIWSARQSAGRGRAGREWHSKAGNLFASLLISCACPLRTASQLALVAGVAAYDTAAKLLGNTETELLLKWPNDILLGGGKVAGMLLESAREPDRGSCVVVVGTGINLANHPDGLSQPATSLAAHGRDVTPAAALETLASFTDHWVTRWGEGFSFGAIRRAWLDRAGPTGRKLRVRLGNDEETEGLFAGLDAAGALRLLMSDGAERRVAAGDVFFANS